jgi:hypothetical protein
MTAGEFALGIVVTTVFIALLAFSSHRLHVRFGPAWSGSPALLSQSTIFVGLLLALSQLLGLVGLFSRWWLVVGASVVAGCVALFVRPPADVPKLSDALRGALTRWRNPQSRATLAGAAVVVAVVVIPWIGRSASAFRTGIQGFDSLNYHLPFAARFAQEGSVTDLHFVVTGLETTFHPLNAELVHAVGMAMLRSDLLSPVLNVAWLALALLAAWCAGLRSGHPLATLAAGGLVLSTPLFVRFDAGRATNDITGCALFLAAAAMLLNADEDVRATAVAAIAAGAALGNKLTLVVPVAALTVGVLVVAARARRRVTAAVWLSWLTISGSFWYLRNLLTVSNPIPALRLGVGPLQLPAPEITRQTPAHSVTHYLLDRDAVSEWLRPGLSNALGSMWWVLLLLGAAGVILAVWKGNSMVRMLGLVAAVGLVGYLFTPQSAGGPDGRPVLFAANLRFGFPALLLAVVLVPIALRVRTAARRWALALGLIAVTVVNVVRYVADGSPNVQLPPALAAVVAFGLFLALGVGTWAAGLRRVLLAGIAAAFLVAAAGAHLAQDRYLERRYRNTADAIPYASAPRPELDLMYAFARSTSDARIAVAGVDNQFPLYGTDLANHVQYVGHRGAHGAFDRARSCSEWRRGVNDGDYDYIITSGETPREPEPREAAWTRSDPGAVVVDRTGTATIFRLARDLDPDACSDQSGS